MYLSTMKKMRCDHCGIEQRFKAGQRTEAEVKSRARKAGWVLWGRGHGRDLCGRCHAIKNPALERAAK